MLANCAMVARPGETNAAKLRRLRIVALLAIGALAYATAVYFVEYIVGFF